MGPPILGPLLEPKSRPQDFTLASINNTTGQQHWPSPLVSTTGRQHWPGPLAAYYKHVGNDDANDVDDDDIGDDDDNDYDVDYDYDDDDDPNGDMTMMMMLIMMMMMILMMMLSWPTNWTAQLGSTSGQHHWPALLTPPDSATDQHHWPAALM
jgi:hypothetical protein